MGLLQAFDISATGMTAQRFRSDIISENVANANTTRTENGQPYKRKVVTFEEKQTTPFSKYLAQASGRNKFLGNGVKVSQVSYDTETPENMTYDPSNPDADENGYVHYPNVNIVTEMTNMIDATRAYEANATAFDSSKSMAMAGLQIGK